jgi:DNA (cytosine-5)-methyltransferase 1
MMRNGIAYRRVPLVPLTDETAYGLLPTPEASNTKAVALRSAGRSPRNFLQRIPTPRANDALKRGEFDETNKRNGLPAFAKKWPTPRVADGKGQGMSKARADKPDSLSAQLGGQLNPTWVEWLMGFPLGWTDLPNWVTRSSRPSRKSSERQSSEP